MNLILPVMDCDGPKQMIIHDLDGSLTGLEARSSILARSEFMHEQRANGDFTWYNIPSKMLYDPCPLVRTGLKPPKTLACMCLLPWRVAASSLWIFLTHTPCLRTCAERPKPPWMGHEQPSSAGGRGRHFHLPEAPAAVVLPGTPSTAWREA